MKVELSSPVSYQLIIGDELVNMNDLIGKNISLQYSGEINCIACGRKTNKSYGQGHCYPCFRDLASCDMCIMKPETCHYDAGTCREPEWGEQHCMQAHYVYLANSSGVKVGITRGTQIPTRWIDQGAGQALPIFNVATRLQSGLLEVELKNHVSDRTDWRKMLKGDPEPIDLAEVRDRLVAESSAVIEELKQRFGNDAIEFLPDAEQVEIQYPVENYPEKIKSFNFDKQEKIEGVLLGIKGQYLILDTGVLNIRKFSGYNIALSVS
ncbi:MAG: DUF2797 domain-containing protein [Gammaproteobacteria bacterium]|nr:DUF2797 domain-containing protein [Gammaproteobacteria bacterium]MCK5262566.1 DUF2797 domain-containing protein [Gammaproteobacteria bacterium]